jgi:hypothetical protein
MALKLRSVFEIVRKLAEALGYAHKQGVVHRDVKPANVMLREDGEPLLMDFGIAARSDETERLTVAGQFMGTPEYTAPEQWRGQAEPASDQYSLGVMLFELLTGEKPFAGASSEHYLLLHTQQPAPSPRTYRPELPCDVETICLKCLEKEPARRYPDCRALADDLRRFEEGRPITARPTGLFERSAKWVKRRPTLVALIVLSLFVLLENIFILPFFLIKAAPKEPAEKWSVSGVALSFAADFHSWCIRQLNSLPPVIAGLAGLALFYSSQVILAWCLYVLLRKVLKQVDRNENWPRRLQFLCSLIGITAVALVTFNTHPGIADLLIVGLNGSAALWVLGRALLGIARRSPSVAP